MQLLMTLKGIFKELIFSQCRKRTIWKATIRGQDRQGRWAGTTGGNLGSGSHCCCRSCCRPSLASANADVVANSLLPAATATKEPQYQHIAASAANAAHPPALAEAATRLSTTG